MIYNPYRYLDNNVFIKNVLLESEYKDKHLFARKFVKEN